MIESIDDKFSQVMSHEELFKNLREATDEFGCIKKVHRGTVRQLERIKQNKLRVLRMKQKNFLIKTFCG